MSTPEVIYQSKSSAGCRLTHHAIMTTTAPLYRRVDPIEHLRNRMPADLAAIDAAAALLRSPHGARLRAAVMSTLPTPDLHDVVLCTTRRPPGSTAVAQGTLFAWRNRGVWTFTPELGGVDRARLLGELKPAAALAIDDPADVARFNQLVADHVAYAAKVQSAATALAADLARTRATRGDAWSFQRSSSR